MRKEKLEITCQEVEHILIKQDIENISEYEQLLVERHIQKCRECEQYDYILLKIKSTMTAVHQEKLIPDPNINKNILKKISRQPMIIYTGWEALKSIFEFRIPVYQVLSVMAVFFLLLIAFSPSDSLTEPTMNIGQESIDLEGVVENLSYRLDSLQLIERQRIGKSVSEDSIMAQFIMPIQPL
jgi:hypothetical protein